MNEIKSRYFLGDKLSTILSDDFDKGGGFIVLWEQSCLY
jgi:hypothetical protein